MIRNAEEAKKNAMLEGWTLNDPIPPPMTVAEAIGYLAALEGPEVKAKDELVLKMADDMAETDRRFYRMRDELEAERERSKVLVETAERVVAHLKFVHRGMPVTTSVYLTGKLEEALAAYRQALRSDASCASDSEAFGQPSSEKEGEKNG